MTNKAQLRRVVHHHVFNTIPPILSLVAIILVIVALTGVGPAHRNTGTFMVIEAGEGSNAFPEELGAKLVMGLLGSCFQLSSDSPKVCSPSGFFQPFNVTLDKAGDLVSRDALPVFIPDAAPLVLTWICLSLLPIVPFVAATMPIHFPQRFAAGRLRSRPFFTVSIVLLCLAWVIGFTATMSMSSEVDTFSAQYNLATAESIVPLNVAKRGDLFVYAAFALFFQVLVGLASLVNREIAPTAEGDLMDETWGHQLGGGVQRRPAGGVVV